MSEVLQSLEIAKKQVVQTMERVTAETMKQRSLWQKIFPRLVEINSPDIFLCLEYDRPYTIAYLSWTPLYGKHAGQVFAVKQRAKVSWPDEWDPERGAEIATKRAIRALADKVIACESLGELAEVLPL